MRSLCTRLVLMFALSLCAFVSGASGQGVTTGAITGTVYDPEGKPMPGAQIEIINRATGFRSATISRSNGLYLIQGLEVGGPYTVRVQSIGMETMERTDVMVTLSQSTRVDFNLATRAIQLSAVEVVSQRTAEMSPTRTGVSSLVTDSLLRRMPSISRDIVDMVKLTPQVVRSADPNGGPSAGGQYNRFNNFTIDGASAADRFNLNSSGGTPGSAAGARLVSVDAVKEFRVAMTPTDVRQGNFTGMLVNAVTKSGTNDFSGGGTLVFRNESFAGKVPTVRRQTINNTLTIDTIDARQAEQSVKQYGFNLGGPIIKDKLHFFIAPEFQERNRPAAGPYEGGGGDLAPNVHSDSIAAIRQALANLIPDIGSAAQFSLNNPLTNLFGRIDWQFANNHRLVLRSIYNRADDEDFFRNSTPFNNAANVQNSGIRLTSNLTTRVHRNFSTVAQLYSNLSNGWQNEVIAGYNNFSDVRKVPLTTPEISVGVTPIGGTSPTAAVTLGTEQFSPKNELREKIFEVVDNLTIPFGAHTVTVGGRFERTEMFNMFAQRLYGVYTFPTIAALRASAPSNYSVAFANSGVEKDIGTDIQPMLFSLYAQDQWAVTDRLTLTYGIRADLPRFSNAPTENPRVTTAFANAGLQNIHTSALPEEKPLWSPRIGFNFDPSGDLKNQIRGNAGIYTGPPPFILVGNAFGNNALGLVTLTCAGAANTPAFTVDINNLAHACRNQTPPAAGAAGTAGINVNDPNFKYPQFYVASAGFDRQLPFGTVLTIEGVYRKAKNSVLIRDLNLRGPRMVGNAFYTDRNGRVLYADTISATGAVTTNTRRYVTNYQGSSFSEGLIEVTNQSEDFNYTISGQLRKRFSDALEGTVAYTYMEAKDVQSLTSDRAISNFRNGRTLSTSHDELTATTSLFEKPHRFLAYGTYTLPTKTDISVYFEAVSGSPITYTTNGDLNGDLVNGNDPIYIPTNAADANEIRWQNATDAAAFDEFINAHECLNDQRGQIMQRHSCRAPLQKRLDVSFRQTLPELRGQRLALQLDVFNFLNLLNDDWGHIELPTLSPTFPQQAALSVVGRTAGPLSQSYPIYTFNSTLRTRGAFQKSNGGANEYQMQLTLRYAF